MYHRLLPGLIQTNARTFHRSVPALGEEEDAVDEAARLTEKWRTETLATVKESSSPVAKYEILLMISHYAGG